MKTLNLYIVVIFYIICRGGDNKNMKTKILIFTVMAVLLLGITSVSAFTPAPPTNLTNTSGCDWINYNWDDGGINVTTDNYNLSWNLSGLHTWYNISSSSTNYNLSGISPGNKYVNVSIWAYNNTGAGNLSATYINDNVTINCPITITGCADIQGEFAGSPTIDLGYSDLDNGTATFDTNATNGTFNTATGVWTWTPVNQSDIGVYHWNFNVTDGYGSTDDCNITVTIVMPTSTSSRGAPALTPIAILGGLALWSTIIVLASKRKRKED